MMARTSTRSGAPVGGRRDLLRRASESIMIGPTLLGASGAGRVPISGRAKALIVLFMWGGPAQQDTWDMKPGAPVEFRGQFQPISTTVPGLQICEHLPLLAAALNNSASSAR
jgi:hypothetical protein